MIRLLTVREAAKESGLSQYFIRNWIKQGKCPGVYSGTRFLVNIEQLETKIREECATAQ